MVMRNYTTFGKTIAKVQTKPRLLHTYAHAKKKHITQTRQKTVIQTQTTARTF